MLCHSVFYGFPKSYTWYSGKAHKNLSIGFRCTAFSHLGRQCRGAVCDWCAAFLLHLTFLKSATAGRAMWPLIGWCFHPLQGKGYFPLMCKPYSVVDPLLLLHNWPYILSVWDGFLCLLSRLKRLLKRFTCGSGMYILTSVLNSWHFEHADWNPPTIHG
jgi:hypothetical protein